MDEGPIDGDAAGQDRKILAAKMLQHGWRAYHSQRAKMDHRQKMKDSESGVPENSILNEPLFYKAALHYAQMRAESVDGALYHYDEIFRCLCIDTIMKRYL